MIKTCRQFFQSRERRPEESIPPMQLRPVNFPVEDGQLLTQGEIRFWCKNYLAIQDRVEK
jgi:hypothetical protein